MKLNRYNFAIHKIAAKIKNKKSSTLENVLVGNNFTAASDGEMLIKVNAVEGNNILDAILPFDKAVDAEKYLKSPPVGTEIIDGKIKVSLTGEERIITPFDGCYPNIQNVYPKPENKKAEISLDAKKLVELLKLAIDMNKTKPFIKISTYDTLIMLEGVSDAVQKWDALLMAVEVRK